MNTAVSVASLASATVIPATALASSDMPNDAEFRRLWGEYCDEVQAYREVGERYIPSSNAVDRDFSATIKDGMSTDERLKLHRRLCRKHKLNKARGEVIAVRDRIEGIVSKIRALEAHSVFALGVKLCAIDDGAGFCSYQSDEYELRDVVLAILPDIRRMSGGNLNLLMFDDEAGD